MFGMERTPDREDIELEGSAVDDLAACIEQEIDRCYGLHWALPSTCVDNAVCTLFPSAVDRNNGRMPFKEEACVAPKWTNVGLPALKLHQLTSGDGCLCFKADAYMAGANVEQYTWGSVEGSILTDTKLDAGSYAVVKCSGEEFLRAILTAPSRFGEAGGHAGLASGSPVEFAGEVKLDCNMKLLAWNLMSGTYALPGECASQAKLPMDRYWRFVPKDEAPHLQGPCPHGEPCATLMQRFSISNAKC